MNRLKPILLVEDSANDVELTLAALEDSHIANPVVVLHDGAEALEFLRSHAAAEDPALLPVVVLLDIKMPKVNGIEALRQMKEDPALKHLPVVMLTSSREGPDIDACYELGVNAYVVKQRVRRADPREKQVCRGQSASYISKTIISIAR
jgi:CheY-like chemotaxis protein